MQLGIFGATGRLGKIVGASSLQDPSFTLIAAIGRSSIGIDYGSFLGITPLNLCISDKPPLELPDLFIDVSLPEGLSSRLQYGRPMVIGTTGFSPEEWNLLEEASRSLPIFYTSNFSLGMALCKKITRDLARLFPKESYIDILETHHAGKRDKPSGSALQLAQAIQTIHPKADIPIHSIRSGQIIGEHTVQFNHTEEKIILSHQVHSRKAFAEGALLAAKFLLGKSAGLYGMDELLAEKQTLSSS